MPPRVGQLPVAAVAPPRKECQVSTHAHQSVQHQQRRVEKNCDPLHENHGSSETEMSAAGWPAVCRRGGSHWKTLQERIRRSRLAVPGGRCKPRALGAACLGLVAINLGFPPLAGHLAMRLAIAGDSS
jgi:hypothetical protein